MEKHPDVHTFRNAELMAASLAEKVFNLVRDSATAGKQLRMAISGGSTPKILFGHMIRKYEDPNFWNHVHFYWVDERCVPPENEESNYRMAYENLLRYLSLPDENIHRIKGEENPVPEAERYSQLILDQVPLKNGIPGFDLVLLGMGDDGHTASIFQEQIELFHSGKICEIATHPVSGQKRITITGQVINNASRVFFLVSGKSKSLGVAQILCGKEQALQLPAGLVDPVNGRLEWFLDDSAASLLNK